MCVLILRHLHAQGTFKTSAGKWVSRAGQCGLIFTQRVQEGMGWREHSPSLGETQSSEEAWEAKSPTAMSPLLTWVVCTKHSCA